jgi:hypothetical protein
MSFRLNILYSAASDGEDLEAWRVVAEYATDQRSSMNTVEIVEDIWNKAAEFMHKAGTHMDSAHIGKEDDLYLFQPITESKVSCTYICPHDGCGAGIRITEYKRKLVLEFKGTHDKNSHRLRIMHGVPRAPDVGGSKTIMMDNSDINDSKLDAFEFIRSQIPYSPVLQEMRRKGNSECNYRRNLNGISESDSNSDTSPIRIRVNSNTRKKLAAARQPYDSPSSMDEPEVEYATEWYSESPDRPSLSPATKKRNHDELEAEMDEMSSMSESEARAEARAIIDARECKNQEDTRKFLEYHSSVKGEVESQFRCGILSDLAPSCAATRRNLAADDSAVALERMEANGSPPHLVRTGQTVRRAAAQPTAPSARIGVPVKHALELHSSPIIVENNDDDEPPQQCTNKSAAANSKRLREQRKAESGAPPIVIQPIPELDMKRLISSKVASHASLRVCLLQLTMCPLTAAV